MPPAARLRIRTSTPYRPPEPPLRRVQNRAQAAGCGPRGVGIGGHGRGGREPDPVPAAGCPPPEPRNRAPDACGSQPAAPALRPAPGALLGCGQSPRCVSVSLCYSRVRTPSGLAIFCQATTRKYRANFEIRSLEPPRHQDTKPSEGRAVRRARGGALGTAWILPHRVLPWRSSLEAMVGNAPATPECPLGVLVSWW